MTRSLVTLLSLIPAFSASAAEGGGHAASEGVDQKALPLFAGQGFWSFLTNSVLVAALVTGLILWFVRRAMKNPQMVPGKKQNVVEFVVEFLYRQTEGILGPNLAKRVFPLLATLFLFITISNWCGLLPGVGTIGFDPHLHSGEWRSAHIATPLIRPATADMNLTAGMALVAFAVWIFVTIKEVGVWGFIVHTFGPKGGLKGCMMWGLIPIFLLVGCIEVISIAVRPVSLSLRLYGNIFAGENLLHAMGNLGTVFGLGPILLFVTSVLFQLPFYFLEILVGLLQGMVFAMLCAVYIKLSTTHEEGHGGGHAAH